MKISNHFLCIIICAVVCIYLSCKRDSDIKLQGKSIASVKPKIQLNWIGHWRDEGDKGKLVREIANEYEFINQDVQVNLKFPEEIYPGMREQEFIVSQIKKPTPDWDIIRLFGYYPEIASMLNDPNWTDKYLVDFSQIPGFLESHNSFMGNKVYKNRFQGKFFGPYNECQVAALFVNTEVAKQMGISVKQFDMTFDDFLGYIKAANEYNKTHKHIIPLFEYDWNKAQTIFRVLFYSLMDNFDEVLDTKLTKKKLDAIEKCFYACEQLSKFNIVEKNWNRHKWATENDYILKDSCLFFPNFTFMYSIWKKNNKELLYKVVPCEYPVFKPSSTYIGGFNSNWAILKNAPHKEEAIKLMMYWCKPFVAEKWVRYSKTPSGTKGSLTASEFGFDPWETYSYMIEKKYKGDLVKDEDWEYMVGEKNRTVPLAITEVLTGSMTAKEAFNNFRKKAVY